MRLLLDTHFALWCKPAIRTGSGAIDAGKTAA